jgi:hypothetical protein
LFWLIPALGYLGLFFVFPLVGLVDARAIPQFELFFCVYCGILLGLLLSRLDRISGQVLAVALVVLVCWWNSLNIEKLPLWLQWNLSGWEAKGPYRHLEKMYAKLDGNYSDGRVMFEHSARNGVAGSTRVFEMLPYFTGRSTLESVYTQATIVAPAVFYLQSLVSKHGSCPFRGYKCSRRDFERAEAGLDLFAVDSFIAIDKKSKKQLHALVGWESQGTYGRWELFFSKKKASYAIPLQAPLTTISDENWRRQFYDWFTAYDGTQPFQVPQSWAPDLSVLLDSDAPRQRPAKCEATVQVDYNRIELHTQCPDQVHLLKFAFHPSWQASGGEQLFPVSPGFIGLIPESETVRLRFGQIWYWKVLKYVSLFSLLATVFFGIRQLFPGRRG